VPETWFGKTTLGALIAGWALLFSGLGVTSVDAQQYDVGVGAGFVIDVPEPFQEEYCEAKAAGLTGSAAWRPLRWLSLEGSAIVTGQLGGESCAIPGLAPPPLDTPILETSYDDELEGVDFFATHASAILEPFAGSAISPALAPGSASAGFGRRTSSIGCGGWACATRSGAMRPTRTSIGGT
jgi:hypothetical protein